MFSPYHKLWQREISLSHFDCIVITELEFEFLSIVPSNFIFKIDHQRMCSASFNDLRKTIPDHL